MEYINLHVSDIDSADFQSAHPIEQATWLKLLRYLCGQENGDRLTGAAKWPERVWVRTCNVTAREVRRKCKLWRWDGDDLVVNFYPHQQEAATKAKRIGGSIGGRKAQAKLQGKLEHNGTEGNETKGNVNGAFPEIPDDKAVADYCAGYTDLARGVHGIPEVWWRGWLSARLARRDFPSDWKRCLLNAFLADHSARHPKAIGVSNFEPKKNSAPPSQHGEPPMPPGFVPADISKMLQ